MNRCYLALDDDKNSSKAYPRILEQLKEKGELISPKLVIFSSDNANFGWYSRMLSNSFPGATVIGATSDTMYNSCGLSRSGISVMAVTDSIDVSAGVLFEVSRYPARTADSITNALSKIDRTDTVCIEFNASTGNCEELVMNTFYDVMGDSGIPLVGCTARVATNPDRPSAVSLNGILYMDACVFAFIHNEKGSIGIVKENMFRPTKHFFTATDVDCDARKVYEFDHKSATGSVASALMIPENELSASSFFHPMGRMEGDDLNIVAVREQNEDGSMSFYSRIYNQTRMVLLDPVEEVEEVWEDTSKRVHAIISDPSFSIILNCNSRMRYFTESGKLVGYNESLIRDYGNFAGFSADGEQNAFRHMNQTMLIISFE